MGSLAEGAGAATCDVAIIGCGMAGLAAGIRLAMYGRKVVILERHNAAGGLNSFYALAGRKYDVGLHAVTNVVPPGTRGAPLTKLCRQLRITREELQLRPQRGSRTVGPGGVGLRFDNDHALLEAEVAAVFPAEIDGYRRLVEAVRAAEELRLDAVTTSARARVGEFLRDPHLVDLLFCPVQYYGSAWADDMDWNQFVILFKALYLEGFGRPPEGVRTIIRVLLDRFRRAGGERRMKCGVQRIVTGNGRVARLELDDGSTLEAGLVLSSAGRVETLRLCDDQPPTVGAEEIGALSFVETITVLDSPPTAFGWDETIVFFNHRARFRYRAPEHDLVDPDSGVICFPNNYAYDEGEGPPDGLLRVTALAHYGRWKALGDAAYGAAKQDWFARVNASARRALPEPVGSDPITRIVARDMFTPTTIEKFTGHLGGAVYGSTVKSRDGRTHLSNLFLCGTDQGFLGIVGAMLSGISMANLHGLQGVKAE